MSLTSPAEFSALLDKLYQNCAVSEVSGRRTEKRNKAVGGDEHSLHLVSLARDVVPDDDAEKKKCIYWCKRLDIVCVDEEDHLHLQPR